MQETITVNGKSYTGKQIIEILYGEQKTGNGEMVNFVNLGGIEYWAQIRRLSVGFFVPPIDSTAYIALGRVDKYEYGLPTWIRL